MEQKDKLSLKALIKILAEINAPKDIEIIKKTYYRYSANQSSKEYKENRTFTASRNLIMSEMEFYTKFLQKKKLFLDSLDPIEKQQYSGLESFNFEICYNEGDQFEMIISDLEQLTFNSEKQAFESTFAHTPGIVTLLDFWATWCGPCQEPMNHNEKMLKEHEEDWKGKVSIVGLSVDDSSFNVQKRVEEANWKRVSHYRFIGGWNEQNKALKYFQIKGIPFVVLLNKEGKIHYMGHPNNCDIESEIQKLITLTNEETYQKQVKEEKKKNFLLYLSKEDFKNIKSFLRGKWPEAMSQYQTFDGYFNLSLSKISVHKIDGTKYSLEKKKLQIAYQINHSQQDQIFALNKLILQQIPAVCVNYVIQKIENPLQNEKNHVIFLYDVAKKYNLPLELVENQKTTLKYSENLNIFQKTQEKEIYNKNLSVEFKIHDNHIKQELKEYYDRNQQNNIENFSSILGNGFTLSLLPEYPPIQERRKYNNRAQQRLNIDFIILGVIFLNFQIVSEEICIDILRQISRLFKKNKEKWSDQVRFIALDIFDTPDCKELLEFHSSEWLDCLEFSFLNDQKNEQIGLYGFQFYPHFVLVGKDGIIRQIGKIDDIQREIEQLLFEDEQVIQKQSILPTENLEELLKLVNEDLHSISQQKIQQNNGDIYLKFSLEITKKFLLTPEGKTFLEFKRPKLLYWVRQDQLHLIEDILQKIFAKVPKELFQIEETISQLVDIPFPGQECELCKTELSDQIPQYYNHFNKKFYCTICAEWENKEKVGNERYKVTDNLVFINAPLKNLNVLKKLDEYKFGKNPKLKDGEAGSEMHAMLCSGCRQSFQIGRFIAIDARPGYIFDDGYIEFCSLCFIEMRNKTSQRYKAWLEQEKKNGLTEDSIYLRVLFNFGYFEF